MAAHDQQGLGRWLGTVRVGLVAGALGGVLFAALSLIRVGSDFYVTSPSDRFATAIVLRSFGSYGLLFTVAGGLLAALLRATLLRRTSPRRLFTWCSSLLVGGITLAFLTVQRQLDTFGALPLAAPERRTGLLLDLIIALAVTLTLAVVQIRLERSGPNATSRRQWAAKVPGVMLSVLLIALAAGELLLQTGGGRSSNVAAQRVVVVGLDGVTFRVLSPLLRSDQLPTFRRLMEEGAWGTLMTYGTASSPRIWTSMATGKKTREHGIDDFVKVDRGYAAVPFKSGDRRVKAIWNILSEAERQVGVIDWHITYPPEEVRGSVVSRLLLQADGRTHPPELDPLVEAWRQQSRPTPISTGRAGIDRAIPLPFFVAERLGDGASSPYDLMAIYSTTPDSVSHRYWKDYQPEAFDAELWRLDPAETDERRGIIPSVYRAFDRELGLLLDRLGDDTLLIVISDHGLLAADRPRSRLHLDRLLAALGFATLEDGRIDHDTSRAFQLTETLWKPILRVNLNIAGREPNGIVPPRRAESLRQRLSGLLREVRFENGEPLFSEVRSEAIGSRRRTAADVELVPRADLWDPAQLERNLIVGDQRLPLARFADVDTAISGAHDRQGVLFLHGPGVHRRYLGQRVFASPIQELIWSLADKIDAVDLLLPPLQKIGLLDTATTLDLTPMVLHVLGEPVARDMAGRPRPSFWTTIPALQWVDTYEDGSRPQQNEEEGEADAEELERLESLGYIN